MHPIEELYQTSWRPCRTEAVPTFPATVPPAPAASPSAQALTPASTPQPKPTGAYRPPGARGLATPDIFKREDEGGAAYVRRDGTATPPRRGGGPNGHNHGHNDHRRDAPGAGDRGNARGANGPDNGPNARRRHVPGAGPPPENQGPRDAAKKPKKQKDRNKKGGEKEKGGVEGEGPAQVQNGAETPRASMDGRRPQHIDIANLPPIVYGGVPETPALETPGGEGLDPAAKKVRNLSKKVCWFGDSLAAGIVLTNIRNSSRP